MVDGISDGLWKALTRSSECILLVGLIYVICATETVAALAVRSLAWLFKDTDGEQPGARPGPATVFGFAVGAVAAYILCSLGAALIRRYVME